MIQIDWLTVWDKFTKRFVEGDFSDKEGKSYLGHPWGIMKEAIEEIVNEQIGKSPDLLIAAAEKAAKTGDVKDLREYLKLRRERR